MSRKSMRDDLVNLMTDGIEEAIAESSDWLRDEDYAELYSRIITHCQRMLAATYCGETRTTASRVETKEWS